MANIINKILGSKKSEYILEFDDVKDNKVVEKVTETVSEVAEKAAQVSGKVLDAADQVTETSGREAKTVKETNIPKKEAKAAKAKAKKSEQPKTNPAEPDLTQSTVEKPQPKTELPPLNSIQKTPEGMTFSTDYLLPKTNGSRRRPGPSLKMFKDMARDVGRR